MKNYTKEQIEVEKLESIICDKCKKAFEDWIDVQEFHYIDFVGGYGSAFGDGRSVKADICQCCLKDLLEDVLRIDEE